MDRVKAPINHCSGVIEGTFAPALVEHLQHAVDSGAPQRTRLPLGALDGYLLSGTPSLCTPKDS